MTAATGRGRRLRPSPVVWTHVVLPLGVGAALASTSAAAAVGDEVLWPVAAAWAVVGALVAYRWFDNAASGVALWWAACLAVAWNSLNYLSRHGGTRTLVEPSIVDGLAVTGSVLAALGIGRSAAQLRSGERVAALVRAQWDAAFGGPPLWASWIVGAGLTLPFLLISSPWWPATDSIWLVLSSHLTWESGLGLLRRTQDVFVPAAVFWPIVKIGGYRLANLVACGLLVAFVSLIGVHGRRLAGGRPIGAFAAVSVCLATSVVLAMPLQLPLYSLMLSLGYTGAWWLHRAMRDAAAPRWLPVAAGISLVLATESHAAGQLFLAVPLLLLALHPWRTARGPLVVALATIVVAEVPRVLVNLSVGGMSGFRSNRTDFMVQRGYLDLVNRSSETTVAGGPPLEYLDVVPDMVRGAFGPRWLVPLLVGLVLAFLVATRRSRWFGAVVVAFYVAALAVAAPTPAARYLLPIVGFAGPVVASATAWLARRGGAARAVAVLAVLATLVTGLDQSHAATHRWLRRHRPTPQLEPLAEIVGDATVLGVRSQHLLRVDPEIRAESSRTLPEDDFVTYLTWPSTREVRDVLDRWDVRFLLLVKDREVEVDYHRNWIEPVYGLDVRHMDRLATDPDACLVAETEDYLLYETVPCAAASSTSSNRGSAASSQ